MPTVLRKFIAIVGALALVLMYLPGLVADISAATQPACCNGIICPMHQMAGGHVECDTAHPNESLKSCPDLEPRYTAALVFVRVAPDIFFTRRVISSGPLFVLHLPINADLGVAPRPPRTSLA
jgi:hypothetical protein